VCSCSYHSTYKLAVKPCDTPLFEINYRDCAGVAWHCAARRFKKTPCQLGLCARRAVAPLPNDPFRRPSSPVLDTPTTTPTTDHTPTPPRTTSQLPPTRPANRQPRDTCNLSTCQPHAPHSLQPPVHTPPRSRRHSAAQRRDSAMTPARCRNARTAPASASAARAAEPPPLPISRSSGCSTGVDGWVCFRSR
jgi:hypothetical protein